jgi:hypothetical protein
VNFDPGYYGFAFYKPFQKWGRTLWIHGMSKIVVCIRNGNVIGHSSLREVWGGQKKKSFIVNGKIKRKYIEPLNQPSLGTNPI